MQEIAIHFVLALVPLPFLYLAYRRYFVFQANALDLTEAILYGIALASGLLLASSYFLTLIPVQGPLATGFVKAALVEKAGAFILLLFFIHRRRAQLITLDTVVWSMMVGLGFSVLENMVYALGSNANIIIVRFLTAVPLHVFTCGMIGYFLSRMFLCSTLYPRIAFFLLALLLPYTLHGLFDGFLLMGGGWTYLVGPLLVMMIFIMEFMLARSQTLPPNEWLEAMELSFEDWRTIQREPQYERWILRSMGSPNAEYEPFVAWQMSYVRMALVAVLVLIAVLFVPMREEVMGLLGVSLRLPEQFMLFLVLPLTFAFNLVLAGAVNPGYFRNSIIRIPIIVDTLIDVGDDIDQAITYDISVANCLLKTVDEIPVGTRVNLHFVCPGFSSPDLEGEVIWDNHINPQQPTGSVVRIINPPTSYHRFLVKYYLFKLSRGLAFNLKLPGFESLRRLFVRPLSVMQQEQGFRAGTELFKEGDEGKQFYLVVKGEIEIYKETEGGERIVMTTLKEGDIFGEMAIVGNQPRSANAVCRTDCRVAIADGDNLDALIESNPQFTQRIILELTRRLQKSEDILRGEISEMETELKRRSRLERVGLAALLTGLGESGGRKSVLDKLDPEPIRRRLGLDREAVGALLEYLGNGTSDEHNGAGLEISLGKKALEAGDKLKLVPAKRKPPARRGK